MNKKEQMMLGIFFAVIAFATNVWAQFLFEYIKETMGFWRSVPYLAIIVFMVFYVYYSIAKDEEEKKDKEKSCITVNIYLGGE